MPVDLPERAVPNPGRSANVGLGPNVGLGAAMDRLRHRWGWFVALGVLAVVLGAAALGLVVFATITTVFIIAIFMIVAGGTEIVVGLNAGTWGRSFLWIVTGLFYLAAGAFAIAQPLHAAVILTLLLGAALLAAGVMRVYIGSHMVSHARTMVMVGGAVTALVGVFIIFGWPANSIVILGTLLGVDLLFTGIIWVGFGLRLRSHA